MTRVKEALNLVYHGTKERDKSELFSDVAEWLAAMRDHVCATAIAAKRAERLASELAVVNGPCDCQEACCAHWQSEAAIILTAALRAAAATAAPAQKIDEATMDWALRELADGWIQNNEREGPHGFYQNARRVLNAIVK